jgi:hypothetical protein
MNAVINIEASHAQGHSLQKSRMFASTLRRNQRSEHAQMKIETIPKEVLLLSLPDPDRVSRCKSMTEAIINCQQVAGIEDKRLCGKDPESIVNDAATWSRIKSGTNNFPQDKLVQFMRRCENAWPLAYLADQCGYALTPKESELERELRMKEEKIRTLYLQISALRDLLQETFKKAA